MLTLANSASGLCGELPTIEGDSCGKMRVSCDDLKLTGGGCNLVEDSDSGWSGWALLVSYPEAGEIGVGGQWVCEAICTKAACSSVTIEAYAICAP
jgi:hypothetical protein